ncbi:MAG: hypothetical protein Q9200_001297 [Gallowayella weberi]
MRSAFLAGAIWAVTVGQALAGVQYGGVNVAGFDFGCETTGKCDTSKVVAPLHEYKGQDGAAQMQHFVKDDRLNAFRLPVAWQFLVEKPGAPLNAANMKQYDALVKACLATGSLCIIDIHNYARWDGQIIGQGGPADEEFADLWSQLATQYKNAPKVAMGIVNEPHEVPDIKRWAQTCQTVVNAIRKAGASDHYILLPGNGYTSAGSFVSSGSAAALQTVKDADGSTEKLIFEVHKYLDSDNSGTNTECISNNIDAFADLTTFLKTNKRQALLAETGGGSQDSSCLKNICELLGYLNQNGDVYLGYLGWGAGSFDATYKLALTPTEGMKDVPLMTQCFAKKFDGGAGTGASSPSGGNGTFSGSSTTNDTSAGTLGGSDGDEEEPTTEPSSSNNTSTGTPGPSSGGQEITTGPPSSNSTSTGTSSGSSGGQETTTGPSSSNSTSTGTSGGSYGGQENTTGPSSSNGTSTGTPGGSHSDGKETTTKTTTSGDSSSNGTSAGVPAASYDQGEETTTTTTLGPSLAKNTSAGTSGGSSNGEEGTTTTTTTGSSGTSASVPGASYDQGEETTTTTSIESSSSNNTSTGPSGNQGGSQSSGLSPQSQGSTSGGSQNASGSANNLGGAARWGSKSRLHKAGETNLNSTIEDASRDDECSADDLKDEIKGGSPQPSSTSASSLPQSSGFSTSYTPSSSSSSTSSAAGNYVPGPSTTGSPNRRRIRAAQM